MATEGIESFVDTISNGAENTIAESHIGLLKMAMIWLRGYLRNLDEFEQSTFEW
jgi:hypothetical protein